MFKFNLKFNNVYYIRIFLLSFLFCLFLVLILAAKERERGVRKDVGFSLGCMRACAGRGVMQRREKRLACFVNLEFVLNLRR